MKKRDRAASRRDLFGSGDYADVKLISALSSVRNALRLSEKENVGGKYRAAINGIIDKKQRKAIDRRKMDGFFAPAVIHAELWPFGTPANRDVRPNGFIADFNNSGRCTMLQRSETLSLSLSLLLSASKFRNLARCTHLFTQGLP